MPREARGRAGTGKITVYRTRRPPADGDACFRRIQAMDLVWGFDFASDTPVDIDTCRPVRAFPLPSALVRTLTPYRGEGYHPYLEAIRVQDHTAERAPRRVHTRRVRGGRPGVRPVRGAAKRGGEGVADEEQVRVISRSCERLRLGSSEWLFDHLFGILDRRRAIVSDFPRFSDGPVFSRCIELSVDARMGPDCPRFR
jgi:hypothetical protein